jgi:rubrerythrin
MVPDRESLVKIFSYYRDAEIRGAALLMKMMARERDPEAQVLFSRHIDDETRHAWLWTKRIKDEGALPVEVPDGYQRRLGKALGIPTSLVDLFALTVIVEERSVKRYTEHARSPICDPKTREVLREVTQDERWHISWMEEWLDKLARARGKQGDVDDTLAKYRRVEQEVFDEMKDLERDWIGFSFSDYEPPVKAIKAR